MCKVYTDVGCINELYHVCPRVRKIIHSLKLVDYLLVQADNPWYNNYIRHCTVWNTLVWCDTVTCWLHDTCILDTKGRAVKCSRLCHIHSDTLDMARNSIFRLALRFNVTCNEFALAVICCLLYHCLSVSRELINHSLFAFRRVIYLL